MKIKRRPHIRAPTSRDDVCCRSQGRKIMKILERAVCASLLAFLLPVQAAEAPASARWRQSPDWVKDLVIYEVATKAFTSPNGPESGTFGSLQARLSYLQDLGVTAI